MEELRTLCFDLGVNYGALPGEGTAAKARELLLHLGRQRQLDTLLEHVHSRGWSPSTRRAFIGLYGSLVRRNILYHVRRCFGTRHLQALADYLVALQEGSPQPKGSGISGEILDIACDTWQDVFVRVWCADNNLVEQWYSYREDRLKEKLPFREFETYLKGAIHNAFWDNLRKRRKHLDTYQEFDGLDEHLGDAPFEEQIPVANEVCFYWDRLLRCQRPDPRAIEDELIRLRREPETVLVWACATLKRRFHDSGKRSSSENLLAFMAFFCSQSGKRLPGDWPRDPQELSYSRVVGQQYRWEEDICGTIFRKRIRKDRPMRQVRDLLAGSRYHTLIEEASS